VSLRQQLSEQIVAVCRDLSQRGYLAAADGNISLKLSDNEILFTPSGRNKARIDASEMALVRLDGTILEGNPSGERLMHLEVYRRAPLARAVVHAHPPTAIAWSIARPDWTELPADAMSELILAVGSIPFVPYARPGTQNMGDVLAPFLPQNRVMILSRHGALSWGESLEEAHNGMDRLEHTAHILKLATELGGITSLPANEVTILREMRKSLGPRTL
jgi:L-fuculose-phosphate aldolase